MQTNMNNKEDRIKALEAQIKLITEELEILKQEEPTEVFNFSMLDKALKQTTLVLDGGGSIMRNTVKPHEMHDVFGAYPNNETAVYAQRLKGFNDRLLAFKYCYDKDYVPNFYDDTKKYFVWYDNEERTYQVSYSVHNIFPFVYFGTPEVAETCARWLNKIRRHIF